jgi:hypothetical protein
VLWGNAGDDELNGGRGVGGFGADDVRGGYGSDRLHAVAKDGQLDRLNCGAGHDVAVVRAGEPTVIVHCERVEVVPNDPNATEEPGETSSSDED